MNKLIPLLLSCSLVLLGGCSNENSNIEAEIIQELEANISVLESRIEDSESRIDDLEYDHVSYSDIDDAVAELRDDVKDCSFYGNEMDDLYYCL